MKYEIILSPEAIEDLYSLKTNQRAIVKDSINIFLRHEPTKISKSRIKRLKGLSQPQYRLRVDDIRIFYDVTEKDVEILAILSKSKASEWLERAGKTDEKDSAL